MLPGSRPRPIDLAMLVLPLPGGPYRKTDLKELTAGPTRSMTSVGLRDYVDKNGFPGIVLGLSGGIDSTLNGG